MAVFQELTAVCIEKIVVATDFSEASERATEYARALALRYGSKLDLIHIFDPSGPPFGDSREAEIPPEQQRGATQEKLERSGRWVADSGVDVTTLLLDGHRPAAALVDAAREHGADLIVAGTRSKTGLERLVLGSTAEQVIRAADCPVLTVGPKVPPPVPGPLSFKSVVFANDFSPEATKAAAYALSFAQESGARLYCCYVLEEIGQAEETFQKALKQRIPESAYDWCSPECVVEHGRAARAILDLAWRVDADLIVLGARKASFWMPMVERGLTPAILAEAACPVLSIC